MSNIDKGILIYYEWIEACESLSPSEFHKLFFAMVDYQQNGTPPPEFKGVTKIIATLIFSQLKRRIDTSKAGKASASKREQESNNANNTVDNDVDNDVDNNANNTVSNYNKTKTKIKTILNIPPYIPPGENENDASNTKTDADEQNENNDKNNKNNIEDMFNEFWSAYPRKVGKGKAKQIFMKLKPSKKLLQTMLEAIKNQKNSIDWTKEKGQFIPHPSTWLNQERWQDELPSDEVPTKSKFKKQGVYL